MAEYKIKEEEKKTILKKHLLRILPFLIIILIVCIGVSFYQINNVKLFIIIIFPTILLCCIASLVGFKFGLKIYKQNHIDIIFKIDNNIFTIIKNGKDFVTFDKEKIQKIEQYKDKSINISLIDKNKILLSDNIENYDNLIKELKNIHPIIYTETKKSNNLYKYGLLIIIMALMSVFYISTNKIMIISTGVIISIFLLFAFIKIFFNKYTDKKIKFAYMAVFIVIYQIIMKILEIL
jgi:hypothetical protein